MRRTRSPVRIAVVGAGLIGAKHVEVLLAGGGDYALAGVADPSDAAKRDAERLGYPHFETLESLLEATGPDGVVIATPTQLHVPNGLACVERGIPILIEKPVAGSVADALRLVTAAEARGVPTLTGHHRRHNPIMRKAAETVASGAIGRIVSTVSVWMTYKPAGYHDVAWRRQPGGGVVLINAIHDIDCLRMLCGDIETVQALTSTAVRGLPVEDTAAAILKFESGALGTLVVSDTVASPWSWEHTSGENPFFPKGPQDAILIGGVKGSLAIPTLDHFWYEPGAESWGTPITHRRIPIAPRDPYLEQMDNFAAVIRGEAEPVLSGRDGTVTLATTLAISQSALVGGPVRVADMMAAAMAGDE